MAKKLVRSKYNVGDIVELTHSYKGYPDGYPFKVGSPFKKKDGTCYMLPVVDFTNPAGEKELTVPTDYIRESKQSAQNTLIYSKK